MSEVNLKDVLFNSFLGQYSSMNNSTNSSTSSFTSYFNNSCQSNTTQMQTTSNNNLEANKTTNFNSNLNKTNVNTNTQSKLENKENTNNSNLNSNNIVISNTSDKDTVTKENYTNERLSTEVSQEIEEEAIEEVVEEVIKEVDIVEETSLEKVITQELEPEFIKFLEELKNKVNENAYMVLMYDPSLLNQIAEILEIPIEDIVNTLSEIGITISDLTQPENLITFVQEALELESSKMLVSVDNIKEKMLEITEIAENISYTENIEANIENINQVVDDLKNLEQELLLVAIPENDDVDKITTLLEKLDGEVVETTEEVNNTILVSSQESLEQNLQNSNQNMNFQNSGNLSEMTDDFSEIQNVTLNSTYDNISFSNISDKILVSRSVNSIQVITQIMDKLKTSLKPDVSEIKLLLRPEELGEVSLKISTQNGIVTAQFIAESQRVKEIIESNFNQLKDMLNEKGIEVSQLDVNINDESNNENARNFEQLASNNEKSDERISDVIQKVFEEENSNEYFEDDEIIISNVNYSA